MVFGSTRGVVKLKFLKLSSSSCNKWTWKDKKHSARVFSLDVNKILRFQVTLNSRYAKNVIRYSFFRIFAEGQESHVSQTVFKARFSNRILRFLFFLIRDLKVLRDP